MKIFDCITFFEENFLLKIRFEILNKFVDYFVICESNYGHDGVKKKINFNKNRYPKFKNKIIHLIIKKFPSNTNRWNKQDYQRNYLFNGIAKAKPDDMIIFSDSDEIPNPFLFEKFKSKNKYFLFIQKHFCYKFNIYNSNEYKWEGSRACKKKYLKDFNWLRTKIRKKNINYPFWRIDKIRNINVLNNGGWHFSYFLTTTQIKNKIKSNPHTEFINKKNLNPKTIKERIKNTLDPLGRNIILKKTKNKTSLPNYINKNKKLFKDWFS